MTETDTLGEPVVPTARDKRAELIRQIESLRESRVVTYICSDRRGAAANIGEDAVRPMYEHVRAIGSTPRLDLYLYSRGGAVEVPWRIISMLREHTEHLSVLIPYRAHSAATLIALGCDEIWMGPKGELGPIDPALNRLTPQEGGSAVQEEIRVEDVMSYIGFIRDKAGLGDQAALAATVRILAEKLSPWVLGNIYRTHSHIRMVARKMLSSHQARMDEARMNLLVESLAEKTYLHGHAIARAEAHDLGLPVKRPDPPLESVMWDLFELYEVRLEMRKPIDPDALIGEAQDDYSGAIDIALIESTFRATAFRGELRLKRVRQAPGQVNINLNLNIALPDGVDPAALPQHIAEDLQRKIQNDVPKLVNEQTRRQSPVLRVEAGIKTGYWRDVTAEAS